MATITLPEELAQRIEEIAQQEHRSVVETVASMVEKYKPRLLSQEASDAALDAIVGVFDDDITDLSTTVRETLHKYYQEKYGRPD